MPNIDLSKMITAEQKAAHAMAATKAAFQAAMQAHVDATARSRNYDGGNALASYVASTNAAWAAEAQAFVSWRDAVWRHVYTEMSKVESGQRAIPETPGAIIAELPVIAWP